VSLEGRRQGLLRLVQQYREQECRRVLAAAQQEAAELLRESFRKERTHLHKRVLAERSRARSLIQAARAEQKTRERWMNERVHLELLESAWPLLKERLLAHWRLPDQRRRWARSYLRQALDLLPRAHWTVRHAPEWREDERREIARELIDVLGRGPAFRSENGIEAGLIVESGGAVLDASLSGLLRDRAGLESRLLALIGAARGTVELFSEDLSQGS
jgi:hypothetical protein